MDPSSSTSSSSDDNEDGDGVQDNATDDIGLVVVTLSTDVMCNLGIVRMDCARRGMAAWVLPLRLKREMLYKHFLICNYMPRLL